MLTSMRSGGRSSRFGPPPGAAEAVGLLRALDDVRVLRDPPERLVARRRAPVDRVLAPQPAPLGVRVAALGVEARRDDVELVEGQRAHVGTGHLAFRSRRRK